MAGLMYGADADELDRLAAELDGYKGELDQLLREGVGAVSLLGLSATLNTIWMGPRAGEFAALWQSRHLLKIREIQSVLEEAAQDLKKNAAEQRSASRASSSGRSSLADRAQSEDAVEDFESRTGFSVDRSVGFILRGGVKDGFEASHGRKGSEVTYATEEYISLETDDAFQALGFVGAVKGKDLEPPVSFGLETRSFDGTQFIWRQDWGSTESSLGGTGEIPVHMTKGWNIVDGYTADEVISDIEAGVLDPPAAVASYTGVSTSASASVEAGNSIFGQEGEVSAQQVLERRADGTSVETMILTGTTSTEAGLHIETGTALSADLVGTVGTEATVELSTIYDSSGQPTSIEYKVITQAEVGTKAEIGFAGGGAYESASQGVLVERTLTFDLTDPVVAGVVAQDASTRGLAWHADWAAEEVRVFSSEGTESGADAILFKVDSDSDSMRLVESQSRGPITNSELHDGGKDFPNRQYVEHPDGSRSTIYTSNF